MAIKLHKSHSNLDTIKKYLAGEKLDIKVYNNITEKEKYREEGEEWELNGVKYKKENGKILRLTKTQGEIIREMLNFKCNHCQMTIKWGTKRDEYFYNRTGLCENCLIEYETKLRIVGAWDVYEKYKLSSYALGDLKEGKFKLQEIVDYFKSNDGDVTLPCENGVGYDAIWKNTNKDKILKDAKYDLKKVKKLISEAAKVKQLNKKLYVEKCKEYKLDII